MGFWTYQYYNFANVFIILALGLITFVVLLILERVTSVTYYLFTQSLFGIHRPIIPKNADSIKVKYPGNKTKEIKAADLKHIIDVFGHHVNINKPKHWIWRIILLVLTGSTIWLFFIQIFTSIFLRYQVVYPNEICPNFVADCFAIPTGTFDYSLIGTASCTPGKTFVFPIVAANGTANCFAWVIKYQDTSSVLAAIGSSAALVTFIGKSFTVMFHLTYEHMRSNRSLIVTVITGVISLWTGVIVYLLQQKVTTNVQTYYALIHIALVKTLALIWGGAADYDELTHDEKMAFWHLRGLAPSHLVQGIETRVTQQLGTMITNAVTLQNDKANASPASTIVSERKRINNKEMKRNPILNSISKIYPEPQERSTNLTDNNQDDPTETNGNDSSPDPDTQGTNSLPCSIM